MSWLSKGIDKTKSNIQNNKKAILGTVLAPGIGTAIGIGLDKQKKLKDAQKKALQDQQDNKNRANQDLTDWNNQVGGTGDNGDQFSKIYTDQYSYDRNGFQSKSPEEQQRIVNQIVAANPIKTPAGSLRSMPMPSASGGAVPQPQVMPAMNPAAAPVAAPSNATPSAPSTITDDRGGIQAGSTNAGQDEGKLLAEAEMQKQLRQQGFDARTASRQKYLSDLSSTLQAQQKAALGDQMPGIMEDLNTRGLLRSSALGEKVGLENTKLARQTGEQLALAGLQDSDAANAEEAGIENSYLGDRSSAIGRRFSLEDFSRQVTAGQKLGFAAAPINAPPKSSKAPSALSGAATGATAGSAAGPWGAGVGAGVGLLAGGQLGSK